MFSNTMTFLECMDYLTKCENVKTVMEAFCKRINSTIIIILV